MLDPITRPLPVQGQKLAQAAPATMSLLPADMDDLLRQIALFKDLDAAELKALKPFFSFYRVQAGTVVCREGEPSDHLLVIAQGAVRVQKRDYANAEKIIGIIDCGKMLGEVALLDGGPRSATCIAVQDTAFIALTRSQFSEILAKHPVAGAKILCRLSASLSRRLRHTSQQLVDYLEV